VKIELFSVWQRKPGNDERKNADTNKNRTDTPDDSAYVKLTGQSCVICRPIHAEGCPALRVVLEGVF
jgi:hypothetical protein